MTDELTYPDQEKNKRKRGEYATDWGMVRTELSVYTTIVWVTFVVFSIMAFIIGGSSSLGMACTAFLVPTMYIVARVFSLGILVVMWVIHNIATHLWGVFEAFHNSVHQSRNTWIAFTILLWIRLFFSQTFLVTLVDIALVGGFPVVMTVVISRIYRIQYIQAVVSLASATAIIAAALTGFSAVTGVVF